MPYMTCLNRPFIAISPNIERRAAQCGAMTPQTKPESIGSRLVRKSNSIIDDR
jgi:hypothetical protein